MLAPHADILPWCRELYRGAGPGKEVFVGIREHAVGDRPARGTRGSSSFQYDGIFRCQLIFVKLPLPSTCSNANSSRTANPAELAGVEPHEPSQTVGNASAHERCSPVGRNMTGNPNAGIRARPESPKVIPEEHSRACKACRDAF